MLRQDGHVLSAGRLARIIRQQNLIKIMYSIGGKAMRCQRCQGCMISDHFMDLLTGSSELDFKGWRCLNCGEITDPVIVHNQQLVVSIPAKSKRRWVVSRSNAVVADRNRAWHAQ